MANQLPISVGIGRQMDYWWTVFKRTWRGGIISSFGAPLFYVLGMGVLLGGFIEGDPDQLEGATSYLAFIVPGLVAAHAMQLAVEETTYPVMGGIKWHKTYHAQLATPLSARDVVNAHLVFVLSRVASACAVFMLVLAPFGVFESWWGPILAFFVQVLVGMAFGTVIFGISARMTSEQGFGLIFRIGVVPLMLFSGAFFPISNLGVVLEWLARVTPLWHGVNLSRMLCLDTMDWSLAGIHLLVLVAVTAFGWWFAIRGLEKRMVD
ncbi:lipooligosaccharide transport system permease protein [Nocardioides daedukensis]|uniref:Lipooligosaccharide transport system permease protein n=1 Tax=Nocardioides daedukensis TaxID=634462 RepID=A0A7Y9RW34_9ACTN|nr:ABC transporter permease [Nocardioides daedukensis]NYG57340.1 lipooligosaccharide transport system permease protein [Nocardioides daedukensis]